MKHFANYIEIYPESVVTWIDATAGTVATSDGSEPDKIYSYKNVKLTENPGNDNGNIYYQQSLRVVAGIKLTQSIREKYGNNRTVVVKLFDDQGSAIILGSHSEKARVLISPNLESDVLSISRKSINPVL